MATAYWRPLTRVKKLKWLPTALLSSLSPFNSDPTHPLSLTCSLVSPGLDFLKWNKVCQAFCPRWVGKGTWTEEDGSEQHFSLCFVIADVMLLYPAFATVPFLIWWPTLYDNKLFLSSFAFIVCSATAWRQLTHIGPVWQCWVYIEQVSMLATPSWLPFLCFEFCGLDRLSHPSETAPPPEFISTAMGISA